MFRTITIAGIVGLLLATSGAGAGELDTTSGYKLLRLGGQTVKWGSPTPGVGATVHYAVVSGDTSFADARNCAAIGSLAPLLTRSHISREAFDGALERAFQAWSSVADITFHAAASADADILIGAQLTPRGRAFTNVAQGPGTLDHTSIVKSVICLNPIAAWKTGFDGDLDVYDLEYALTHEIGHAIGLDHPGIPGLLMDFRYRESFAALQAGDRAGAIALYGAHQGETATAAHDSPSSPSGGDVAELAFPAPATE